MGLRNLQKASRDAGIPVKVNWMPFLLDPNTPKEGEDLLEHLQKKYGVEVVRRFNSPNNPLDSAGDKVGIRFNKSRRFINTVDCHRLMELCNSSFPDQSELLMENMFRAYFEEAKDLSQSAELMAVATQTGLAEAAVQDLLQSQRLESEVLALDRRAKTSLRVSGVPFFIIESNNGGKPVSFSGAQPPEVISDVLLDAV